MMYYGYVTILSRERGKETINSRDRVIIVRQLKAKF